MFIHRSNRLERLVEALCAVIADGPGDPMASETIVVQSQGMARYLSLQLSEQRSVWANPSFPFPRALLEQALLAVLGPVTPTTVGQAARPAVPLDREALQLALAARLPGHLSEPAFLPLARYLSGDTGGDKLLPLCERVGQLFDDYTVFRSDWVHDWEAGAEADDWQAVAMRALGQDFGAYHVGARSRAFFAALSEWSGPIEHFPARLCVFGISSLPPLYVRMLSALSRHLPVHLFLLSPTREYWADLRTPQEQERLRRGLGATEAAGLHLTEGHPLLASFGRLGRELFAVIESEESHHDGEFEAYVEPGEDTLLQRLQSDMLSLRARAGDDARPSIAADDDSLAVHVCHSATREVEVLHDQLCGLLDKHPDLDPEDIVVMAPDIEVYAPAVEAVFSHSGQRDVGRPAIPFRIADRGLLSAQPNLDAFLQVIELLGSRFEAPAVLDVLALAPVRARFEIALEELDALRTWVDRAGIRWGVDADHRAELGQPRLVGNTFRFGLERLMLGYAMEGHGHRLFAGCLPFDDVEGSGAGLLGRFAAFCETLFEFRTRLSGEHALSEWRVRLSALLERVLSADAQGEQELQGLREALDALVTEAAQVGFEGAIGVRPLTRLLARRLSERRGAVGFMSGGVTFCQLLPMRSLPFQVVVLLGMDDASFPRQDRPLGFDKRRAAPRLGDRSLRNDDRYLFLEAILSARRKLLISYVGRGIHDNTARPPSVMLAELLDALDRQYHFAAGSAREQLCVVHRLQPFSPAYFGAEPEARLWSFAAHYCQGAEALAGAREQPRPAFAVAPLPPPEETGPVPLDLLERYASHPIRTFMQARLGLFLGRDLSPLPARERLVLDPLSRWQAGDELLSLASGGAVPASELARLKQAALSGGQLPLGTPGQVTYEGLYPSVASISAHAQALRGGAESGRRQPFSLALAGLTLEGQLDGLGSEALVAHQYSRVGRRFELSLWVRHLVMNALGERAPELALPRTTALVGRPNKGDGAVLVRFAPVAEPETVLSGLLELFALAQCFPVPFNQDVSRAYAVAIADGQGAEKALAQARRAFEHPTTGDATDAYVALAYPDFDALCDSPVIPFERVAEAVFGPLLAHRSEELLS